MMAAARLVPERIPDQYRSDMCQDLIVAFLSGKIEQENPRADEVKRQMRRTWRMHDMNYETVSLDAPISPDAVKTFADFLTYDDLNRWDVNR